MDEAAPFFSVIITTYNRATLIGRAIKSLMAQTFCDWESIIIDDGSTDNTQEVIERFLPGCHQLHYYKSPPRGATQSKNDGIALAHGKYIAFLDSDDEYMPDYLEAREKFINENPGVSFLHGGIKVIGDPYLPDKDHPGKKIHISECAVGGSFIIARSIINKLGVFKEIPLGSDSEYLKRARNSGFIIAEIGQIGYIYHREQGNTITNNFMKYGWMGMNKN